LNEISLEDAEINALKEEFEKGRRDE